MKTPWILSLSAAGILLFAGCGSQDVSGTSQVLETGEQVVDIQVDHGYAPNNITAKAGTPLTLRFHRNEPGSGSCAQELEIPAQGISQTLPNNQVTKIAVPPQKAGTTLAFNCSMDMMKGQIHFVD